MRAEQVVAARSMPAVFAEVTVAQAVELSRHPAVARLLSGATSKPVELGPPGTPGNSITVPKVDDVLNQSGYLGAEQKIGLIEDARCRLFSEHDTFNSTQIVEEDLSSIYECQKHSFCASRCGGESKCVNSGSTRHCVDDHVSRIASEVAQSIPAGLYGAPHAEIYHPNLGDGTDIQCLPIGYRQCLRLVG